MAVPFYVSPDQMYQDRAEYARKGIAKGRSIVALECSTGILLAAENPSTCLLYTSPSPRDGLLSRMPSSA